MLRTMFLLMTASFALAQPPVAPAGDWISHRKYFDTNFYQRMRVEVSASGTSLSGKFGKDDLSGTFRNGHFEASVNLCHKRPFD